MSRSSFAVLCDGHVSRDLVHVLLVCRRRTEFHRLGVLEYVKCVTCWDVVHLSGGYNLFPAVVVNKSELAIEEISPVRALATVVVRAVVGASGDALEVSRVITPLTRRAS